MGDMRMLRVISVGAMSGNNEAEWLQTINARGNSSYA
jgi:hypothetical protein